MTTRYIVIVEAKTISMLVWKLPQQNSIFHEYIRRARSIWDECLINVQYIIKCWYRDWIAQNTVAEIIHGIFTFRNWLTGTKPSEKQPLFFWACATLPAVCQTVFRTKNVYMFPVVAVTSPSHNKMKKFDNNQKEFSHTSI